MKLWLTIGAFLFVAGCRSQGNPNNGAEEPAVFRDGLKNAQVQLLDVRTAEEFRNGHIARALQANWKDMAQFTDRVQYLDKNKPVYVYCLAGPRSTAAAAWLRQNGFREVVELKGGFKAWRAENLPVEGLVSSPQITPEQYLASIPADKTTLVDVGAAWCPPCVKMAPVIEELQKDPSLHFTLMKVDAGEQVELLKYLGIDPIPVFIVYKNGKEVWRKQGIVSRDELSAQLK